MSLIIPANSASAAGGYAVDNSCRFNSGSSDSLTRTLGTPTNNKKWTYSFWIKHCDNVGNLLNTGSDTAYIYFRPNNANPAPSGFSIEQYQSGFQYRIIPNMVFRDHSAWRHIVIAFDTTQGTDTNRVKVYNNGTQITSFNTATYPSQNLDTQVNSAVSHKIGGFASGANFDGYMSEVCFIDGQQLAPDQFGEFDEDSGIWKPIDGLADDLTFGNNGFYLDFKNSGALGADVSGNTNNFTVNNLTAIDQSTDTCTNNFCTLNPLINIEGSYTLSEGNTIFTATGANDATFGTIAVSSGKWYFEAEFDSIKEACYAGFADVELINNIGTGHPITSFIGQYRDDYAIQIGGSNDGAYTDVANGDIFGFAINLDAGSGSKTVVIQKNGTTTDTVTIPTANENNGFIPVVGDTTGGNPSGILKCNFGGSPPVAPSSSVADANGFGSFEYNPTIGGVDYLAICTKNLSEYG